MEGVGGEITLLFGRAVLLRLGVDGLQTVERRVDL
jgi:hypothetical protein